MAGKDNLIIIGRGCSISGVSFYMRGSGNRIIIEDNVTINGSNRSLVSINVAETTKIIIGEGSLLSNNIKIHTTDYHSILDAQGHRINYSKDVCIDSNVWIGLGCIILKGTRIPKGCVVAAGSILTKDYSDEGNSTIIAGTPARVVKKNISWKRELI